MLEHPEISWIRQTGYPSWLQEPGGCRPQIFGRRKYSVKSKNSVGNELSNAAGEDQSLRSLLFPSAAEGGGPDFGLPPG